MKIFCFFLLLAIISQSAMAEWVRVGEGLGNTYASYIDPASMHKLGSKRVIWTVLNFSKAQTSGNQTYLSIKSQHEYDCKEKEVRMLDTSLYSGNMAQGDEITSSSVPTGKKIIPPESMLEGLWEYTCGMK